MPTIIDGLDNPNAIQQTVDAIKQMVEPPCPGCKGTGEGDAGDCPCAECGGTGKFENSIHDPKRGWCHMCRVTNMTQCHHKKRR